MSDSQLPPPSEPATGWQPITPPDRPQAKAKMPTRSKVMIGGALTIGVLALIGVATNNDDDATDTPPAEVNVEDAMNAACGKPSYRGCQIEWQQIGDAQTLTMKGEGTEAGVRVVVAWGAASGCLEDVDLARIGETRALDGMVESASGRSTWTYHPDDGLSIVCGP